MSLKSHLVTVGFIFLIVSRSIRAYTPERQKSKGRVAFSRSQLGSTHCVMKSVDAPMCFRFGLCEAVTVMEETGNVEAA